MATPVLLIATATRWFASARMPRALAKAGFEPSLLTRRGSLAEHSGFLSKVGHLPDADDLTEWVFALAAVVKATSPRLVIPCDDAALRFLVSLALAPPEGLDPTVQSQLASLVRDSLGDPAHYRDSLDKTMLPPAAEAMGIAVPPYLVAREVSAAQDFARRNAFPVVLKRGDSSSRSGLAICTDAAQLARSFAELNRGSAGRLLVQAWISGPAKVYPSVAWNGVMLVGYAGMRLVNDPDPGGVPAVNRYYASPELRAMTITLAASFGISGFFAPDFVEDARTGRNYFVGINRRIVGGAHRGAAINADHWTALHAKLQGVASPTRSDLDAGEEHVAVDFPQEWLRDPQSRWLREYPVDLPWDEPKLVEAMLAVRRER
jgi:predicted ATP-grasp superfamily ATP-dependent carboligase